MSNSNWIRSIFKSYNQLDEVNQAKSSEITGKGIGRKSQIGRTPKDKDRAVLFATGAAHAQQGFPPHPQGANDPHYMDGYKSIASPNLNEAKNINNNMKNNKSWIHQLSESYIRHTLNENTDTHQKIVDFLADRVSQYPHKINKKTFRPDREASAAHIREILNATGPHTDAAAAVEAIRPHAIEANSGLDELAYTEGDYGTDITELPNYDQIAAENEERFANRLVNDLHGHITGK